MMNFPVLRAAAVLLAAVCGGTSAPLKAADELSYRSIAFSLPASQRLVPADMDGDGRTDLLADDAGGLAVYLQQRGAASPFRFASAHGRIELPGEATGWALDAAANGGRRLLALVDGRQVLAWTVGRQGFSKAAVLLESASGLLPAGRYPLDFVRDINGDGRSDLIVPGSDSLNIHLQQPDGSYAEAIQVKTRVLNWSRLRAEENLAAKVGQNLRIPALSIRDLNQDGRMDLVSSSEDSLDVFLAAPDGRFPARPSYSVDLQALQERVGELDLDNLDYSNLSGLLAHTYEIELEDMDGDGVEDLLVREGGKITLFGGKPDGMNMEQPRQVLKSSGNVLAITLRDEDGDGRKDLWLMRVQDISLGNLFLWLAVSGSVDIETFVYRNEGRRFASRPHRKVTLAVKFPSILSSVDVVSGALDPDSTAGSPATARANLDHEAAQDVAVLGETALAIYMNAMPAASTERFLGQANFSRDRNHYVYDLGAALSEATSKRELQAIRGREPSFQVKLGAGEARLDPSRSALVAWEVNGDGRDDFFVLSERSENAVEGFLLLSE